MGGQANNSKNQNNCVMRSTPNRIFIQSEIYVTNELLVQSKNYVTSEVSFVSYWNPLDFMDFFI